MPELLAIKDFAPHLRTIFRVQAPTALDLELAEVREKSNAQLEQFSLLFTGPESPWLAQGTYTLLHPVMQQVTLFMGPKGPRDGRMVYEAVFSRHIASSRQPEAG